MLPLGGQPDNTHELVARSTFEAYSCSRPEEHAVLLDRYRLVDVAFKVVGIGSVGTFCAIGLFATPDDATLLLQVKEAQESVLAGFTAPSMFTDQGQRAVVGQRIMQGEDDIFLDWMREHRSDQCCYVRELKDARLAAVGTALTDGALPCHATLCGRTLARAHARSGDARADHRIHWVRLALSMRRSPISPWRMPAGEARLAGIRRGDPVRCPGGAQRMISPGLLDAAAALLEACRRRRIKLATAESCTGGLLGAVLTAIAGSSEVVERGFVAYSNQAKTELLGVSAGLIGEFGAVSEPVVRAMAEGALWRSHADIVLAVTGMAGPGGGSADKPVGLVWFGLAQRGGATLSERRVFPGDRTAIRVAAVEHALGMILARIESRLRA